MTRNEHRLPVDGAGEIDSKVVGRDGGFAVFIGAQNREIERPSGKLEIIRVAAERGDARLRREHQAHVVIALVLVYKVLPSLIKRHRLASQSAGFGFGARLFARLLENREGAFTGLVGRRIV